MMLDKMLVFVLGAVTGSFLNVCIHRLPKKESVVFPASHCPKCKRAIAWHDNVPLVSYLVLRGKCRLCGSRIPFRYFAVELLTPVILLLLYVSFGLSAKFFAYSIFACGLIIATFVDFEIQEIPDEISLGGTALALILAFLVPSLFDASSRLNGLVSSFVGALVGGGLIYAMKVLGTVVFRNKVRELKIDSAMGDGDVKLMAMIGAFLGWKLGLFTFFIAPVFGAIVGIFLKLKYGREIIPYGPYLSLAAIIAVFFGNGIMGIFFGGIF